MSKEASNSNITLYFWTYMLIISVVFMGFEVLINPICLAVICLTVVGWLNKWIGGRDGHDN